MWRPAEDIPERFSRCPKVQKIGKRIAIVLFGVMAVACSGSSTAFAPNAPRSFLFKKTDARFQNKPITLTATNISYDPDTKVFQASGNVVLHQEGYCLKTDVLRYDEAKNRLFACGNLWVEDPEGNIFLGEKAELSGDFKDVVISHIRGLTHNRERITATQFIKHDSQEAYEMASYTPCELCGDDPPVWELHARHVRRDTTKETLEYKDVHLEFLGQPIAYLPYFFTPLKRMEGFLLPSFSSTKELGLYLGIPYYWTFGVDKDLMVTPFFTTSGGIMLAEDYRQKFKNGSIRLQGALNVDEKQIFENDTETGVTQIQPFRGYVHGELPYDFSDHWRLRVDEWWVSDKTFLSTRPFFGKTTAPFLESQTKLEGFYPNHFAGIRGMHYQGLRKSDEDKRSPVLYPEMYYSYASPIGWQNSRFVINLNGLSLYQKPNIQIQRAVGEGQWDCPIPLPMGQTAQIFARLTMAGYHSKNPVPLNFLEEILEETLDLEENSDNVISWAFPQAGILYNWPVMVSNCLITPTVQVVCGPSTVPQTLNLDSKDISFVATNLFQANRFPGYDGVDVGSRVTYGISADFLVSPGNNAQIFLGQTYGLTPPNPMLQLVGIYKGVSDIVGYIKTFFERPNCHILYGAKFARDTFAARSQEILGQIGPPIFLVRGSYSFIMPSSAVPGINLYNQLVMEVSSKFTKFWSVKVFFTRNFKGVDMPSTTMDKGIGITYEDECFSMGVKTQYSSYQFNDLQPGLSVDLFINFKNIGGVRRRIDRFSPIWSSSEGPDGGVYAIPATP